MARPIKKIKINDIFDSKNIKYSDIKSGNILTFDYSGDNVNDKNPLVFVIEFRNDRIYGFNLRYKPTLVVEAKNKKIEEIQKRLDSKLKEINTNNIDSNLKKKITSMLIDEIPINMLDFFVINVSSTSSKYLLRNYLPSKIKSLKLLSLKKNLINGN